jgi:hypothetical protein
MTTSGVRTTEQRIQRIRERLCNGQAGYQMADVDALLTAYERVAADLAGQTQRVEQACFMYSFTYSFAPNGKSLVEVDVIRRALAPASASVT